MLKNEITRRQFVQTSAGLAALAGQPLLDDQPVAGRGIEERAALGRRDRPGRPGHAATRSAPASYGDIVAVCDVQRQHAERAKEKHFNKADIFEDYRKLLDRKDIEAVTIGTPDHWHTEIALGRARSRQARLLRKAADADDRRRQAAGGQRSRRPAR